VRRELSAHLRVVGLLGFPNNMTPSLFMTALISPPRLDVVDDDIDGLSFLPRSTVDNFNLWFAIMPPMGEVEDAITILTSCNVRRVTQPSCSWEEQSAFFFQSQAHGEKIFCRYVKHGGGSFPVPFSF